MSRQSSQDFLAATSAVHTQGRTLLLCVPRRENSSTLTNTFGPSRKNDIKRKQVDFEDLCS